LKRYRQLTASATIVRKYIDQELSKTGSNQQICHRLEVYNCETKGHVAMSYTYLSMYVRVVVPEGGGLPS